MDREHEEEQALAEQQLWEQRTRIMLLPTSPPPILGLFALSLPTFIGGGLLAGWFGNAVAIMSVFPFLATLGGLTQLLSAMWAYRSRDAIAVTLHGVWGSFFLAIGAGTFLSGLGIVPVPAGFVPEVGFLLIVFAAITWSVAVAAAGENFMVVGVACTLAAATTLGACTEWLKMPGLLRAAGWLLVACAALCWYTATAILMEETFKRVILPTGRLGSRANIPGHRLTHPVGYRYGMPGAKEGQ